MEYILTPYSETNEKYAWWDGAFNEDELSWLQKQAKNSQSKGVVGFGENSEINSTVRRSGVNWMPNVPNTEWVFKRLAHVVSSLNAQFFRFDLTGFGEPIQLASYDSSENGTYGWHIDMGSVADSPCRKLSVVMQLSDPSEYVNGELELKLVNNNAVRIKKQRGLIVAFPSWTLHQVTPVTQGNRQSLVAWISGPAFK